MMYYLRNAQDWWSVIILLWHLQQQKYIWDGLDTCSFLFWGLLFFYQKRAIQSFLLFSICFGRFIFNNCHYFLVTLLLLKGMAVIFPFSSVLFWSFLLLKVMRFYFFVLFSTQPYFVQQKTKTMNNNKKVMKTLRYIALLLLFKSFSLGSVSNTLHLTCYLKK